MFGTITTKRITYFAKKNWFSGGYREDIPLKQVVSIRHETSRNIFWGLTFLLIGLSCFSGNDAKYFLVGSVLSLLGGLMLWGSPTVNVVTAGGTQSPATGYPWQRKEAEAFVSSLRNQVFTDN